MTNNPIPSLPEGPADGVTCSPEYAHPFFVYDFMPQKIMFKSERGDDTTALDVLRVRGWSYLTGQGEAALKISYEAAAAIQDNFGKWVAKTLTEALTAPADGVTQTGWQPIETAPERTDVLVCVTHNTPDFQWETIQWVDWHVAGRWEIYGDRIDIPFPPSYWQPLPPPPQDKTL